MAVGDGDDDGLHRGEPEGEGAGVVLDEVGHHALHGADDASMDDHRPVLRAVLADVGDIELVGQVEVDLDGRERLLPAHRIAELDVQLRPVERGFAYRLGEGQVEFGHRLAQHRLGHLPHGVVGGVLLRVRRVAKGELVGVFGNAERVVGFLDQPHHVRELGLDLLRRAEDVGVVERHRPHAAEPAHDAGPLVPVHRPHLGEADGQVSIAAQLRCVDEDVVRAVHGPEHHLLVLQLHDREHVVLEVIPVAGQLVQIFLGYVRRIDVAVAGLALQLRDELLQQPTDGCAFREPEGQAGADQLVGGEELQLPAEAAMVALLGLFHHGQVRFQLLFLLEEEAVDALEHGLVLVAPPVGAGHAGELEGAHLAGALHVGAFAQVGELSMFVEAHLVDLDAVDQLELERLIGEEATRFVLVHLAMEEGVVGGDGGAHPLIDSAQVFGCERTGQLEVVVEAVLDRRADGELGAGEELQHRLRHDMGGGVAHAVDAVFLRQLVERLRHSDLTLAWSRCAVDLRRWALVYTESGSR